MSVHQPGLELDPSPPKLAYEMSTEDFKPKSCDKAAQFKCGCLLLGFPYLEWYYYRIKFIKYEPFEVSIRDRIRPKRTAES